uniref:Uncharacterized protein n=1 Tax=Romanomermis culicivorax TaxID=13658 RepID=A0A915KVN4_ROMCU
MFQSPVLQTLQPLQNFEIVNLPNLNNNSHALPPTAYSAMQNLHAIQQQQQHHHQQQEGRTTTTVMMDNNNNPAVLSTFSSVNQNQQQISLQNHGGIFSQQSMDSQTIDIQ